MSNTNMLVEVCALMHIFQKCPRCSPIGAWALIRMNTVITKTCLSIYRVFFQMQTLKISLEKF